MARARHSEATKARAVELYATHGTAETLRLLATEGQRVAKSTLRGWASTAGVRTDGTQNARARTEAATAAAAAARRLRASQALEALVPLLADVALCAAETELYVHRAMARLRANAYPDDELEDALAALESTHGPGSPYETRVTRAKDRVAVASFGPRLSEIVGSRTRAVHDLVILRGDEPGNAGGVTPAELLGQARERRLFLAGGTD